MSHFAPVSLVELLRLDEAERHTALAAQKERIVELEADLGVFACLGAPSSTDGKDPFASISIGIKDIFDTHDLPTAYGSPIYQDHQPVSDAALVSRLRTLGAHLVGKTETTEFAWMKPGKTRNPHNLAHTPGGSSSGSAAGVAAGFFPAAIGSQTGGSVIRPAAFCGIAGYKPSFRLFPTIGMKHFSWSLDTPGFFGRDVMDVAQFSALLSERDLAVADNVGAPKFGLYRSSIDGEMSPEMTRTLEKAASACSDAGASLVEIAPINAVEAAHKAHAPVQDFEALQALADERRRHPSLLSKELALHLKAAEAITPEIYDNNRRIANHARKASRALFADCDVLLVPSAPGAAPHSLRSTGNSIFNRLWTLLGLPCVNVPGLFNEKGLPLGVQIVAPFGQDKLALQAAHWVQRNAIPRCA